MPTPGRASAKEKEEKDWISRKEDHRVRKQNPHVLISGQDLSVFRYVEGKPYSLTAF
jgi:hypothetical protein